MWIHKLQDCLSPRLIRVHFDSMYTRLLCNYTVISLTIWLEEFAVTTGISKKKRSCCSGTTSHDNRSLLVLNGGGAWVRIVPVPSARSSGTGIPGEQQLWMGWQSILQPCLLRGKGTTGPGTG